MSSMDDITSWRVMIVDDEPDNLTLASEFLTFSGATVEKVESGERSLERIDYFKPTIILLDLAMPGLDGWETHQRLRARADLRMVPIVALTALAMPEDAARVKAAGFDGYITKPFRVAALLRDLRGFVQAFWARKGNYPSESGDALYP